MIKLRIISLPILVAVLFFGSTGIIDVFAAGTTPGCEIFVISEQCDLSGWMHLLLGDAVTGALLGLLYHFLSHKTNKKIEHIINETEQLRKRRKDYSIQQLKISFNGILFSLGSVNKSVSHYNQQLKNLKSNDTDMQKMLLTKDVEIEKLKLEHNLQRIQNIIISTNDVLEPDVTNQINAVITFIGEITFEEQKNKLLIYPKYDICKRKTKYIIEMLKS